MSQPQESSKNTRIIEIFDQLRVMRELQNEPYKARAYAKAIESIRNYPSEIKSGKEALSIPGIGRSLSSKIDEILKTGTVKELSASENFEDKEKEETIKRFTCLGGVGVATALKWYLKGYRRLEDVPPNEMTRAQYINIALDQEFKQRIPRAEIAKFEQSLHQCLDPLGIHFQIAGSYRRGLPDSGDIDILVVNKPGLDLIEIVTQCPGFIKELYLAKGSKKYRGVALIDKIRRRVDIELVEPHEYPFALVYFTGPASFNIKMRSHAAQYGLTLNEKGLFDQKGNSYPVNSEEELFRILGLLYLTPEQRNNY